ncbi:MAG: aspartate aminotransferase family protein, partial [Gammaproteobacteria bacterium]|nr:aspartate aminotransferase family protein [Gammaproteobacteria bacterium]
MNDDDFKAWSRRAADWGAAYRASLRDQPVRPITEPGAVAATIAARPPESPEAMEAIFADFETLIAPHMTHWQHPRFFAY